MWFEQNNKIVIWIEQVAKLESCNISSITVLVDGSIEKVLIALWLLLNFIYRKS